MITRRITINGETYESPESMPPEVRRVFEETMRQANPVLHDRDGNGIPDIVEGATAPDRSGLVVDQQIVVNRQSYRTPDEMPADVRRLYEDAMGQVRQGSGVRFTHEGPTVSLTFSSGRKPHALPGDRAPGAIEPSGIESGFRTTLVLLAIVVIGGLAAWAFLGR